MPRLAVLASLAVPALLATTSCAQILGLDDPKRADDGADAALPGAHTLRHDTVDDFKDPAAVLDGVVVETWGALGPAARPVGALLARGYRSKLFPDVDAASYPDLVAKAPAGMTYLSPGPLAMVGNIPVGAGITEATSWTLLLEGEVWLEHGIHDWKLTADDVGFVDLGGNGADWVRLVKADTAHAGTARSDIQADGWHPIRMAVLQKETTAALLLMHKGPGDDAMSPLPAYRLRAPGAPVDGLLAQGFAGSRMTDARTVAVHAADALAVDYGANGPAELGVTVNDFFAVRWSGQVRIDKAAGYRFHVVSDEGHRVWIDGARTLDNWKDESGEGDVTVSLDVGWHDFAVDLRELAGTSKIQLALTEPADAAGPIPVARLRPSLLRTPGVTGLRQDAGGAAIPDKSPTGVAIPLALAAPADAVVESIELSAEYAHARRSDLSVAVRSPDGVEHTVVRTGELTGAGTTLSRVSSDHAGQRAAGTWQVIVRDGVAGTAGTLSEAALTVHYRGGESPVLPSATYTSAPLDLSLAAGGAPVVGIDAVRFVARAPAGSAVVVRARTCDSADACGGQPWSAPLTSGVQSGLTPRRYAQYQVALTTDGSSVPSLDAIELAYRTGP